VTTSSGKMMLIWSSNKTIRGEGWDASYTITVGTGEKEIFNNLTIFPNPSNDKVNIKFAIEGTQNIKIELLSLTGNTLFSETLNNFKGAYAKTLDVSDFAKGIYFLRITADSGVTNKKIIVH
jgi:hypothetical protein